MAQKLDSVGPVANETSCAPSSSTRDSNFFDKILKLFMRESITGKESFTAYVTDLSTNNQTTLVGSVEFGLSPGDSIGCTLDSYQYLDYKPNAIKVLLIRQYPSQNPDGSFSWIPDPVWTSFQMKRQGNEYVTVEDSSN